MFLLNTQVVTKAFADYVVQQARTNLTKGGKNVSKDLYNSITKEVVSDPNNNYTIIGFSMDGYGQFIDRGVKGKGGTKKNGEQWKLKTVTNSPFAYTNKRPPTKSFDKWVIKRGLAPRSKSGKFLNRQGMKFAIANSVFHTGIETTNFFTRPLELGFKKYVDTDLMKAFSQDVDIMIDYNLIKK
jgi:hypothetical protein